MIISTAHWTSTSTSSSTRRPPSLSGWRGNPCGGAGIHSGDVLIVDRALAPGDGSVIIAIVNGKLTLVPENHQYPPLAITETTAFEVWGVVTYVIHRV